MKKGLMGILLAGSLVMLTGCAAAKKLEFDSVEAAKTAMNTASVIGIEGDSIADANRTENILADGKVAGFLEEQGFWNSKILVTLDSNTWLYMKYVTDEPVNKDREGVLTATTYGFYDAEDKCLGYLQEQLMETDIFPRDYYYVFLDADGNPGEYLADEEGENVYDYDGNLICTASAQMDSIFGNDYSIKIRMEPGVDAEIDFMYKLGMSARLYYELNDWYVSTQN